MQVNQVGQFIPIHRIVWAGDYDSLKFSRVAFISQGISGLFFRPVVVSLVSVIRILPDIYHHRHRWSLLPEAWRYEG